ncbi:MAG: DUF3806 domain-containing protein [Planctomycetaceae bacterium]|nr:DUF3806 domain-containing protein [Planctomycetaceae bacterium]
MQKFSELSPSEEQWIKHQLEGANAFLAAFAPESPPTHSLLDRLDSAFAAWMATQESDVDLVNKVINCVGTVFGQELVNELELCWVIVEDEHGTELAVKGTPEQGDALVFPANFVAKRWERKETTFLSDSLDKIRDNLAAVSQPSGSKKQWWKIW